jgi:hypothetical protein
LDRPSVTVPAAVALALALLYLFAWPRTADLAAQAARGELFSRAGDVAWWAGWYGGTSTASYSLTTPALLGLLGPVWLGAISLAATPLAALPVLALARRPLAGGVGLALVAAADVAVGRTTFAVGVVAALLSLGAASRGRGWIAAAFGLLTVVTSPVAGVLALIPATAAGIVNVRRRTAWLAAAAGILVGLLLLWLLSGGGVAGSQPFSAVDALPVLGTCLVVAISPVGRALRLTAALGIVAALGAFVISSPMGSNMARLVLLGAVPAVLANARLARAGLLLAAALAAVLPVTNLVGELMAANRPGSSQPFVAGLQNRLLATPGLAGERVEVVDVATHWPSTRLLPTVTLARGWERQADEALNPEFYRAGALSSLSYRDFLDRNAVGLVAVPTAVQLDFGSVAEAALIDQGLPYLHQIWSDANWRLYAVDRPAPAVEGAATNIRFTDAGLDFTAAAAGDYLLRMRWSPTLVVDHGTVERQSDNTVLVHLDQPGPARVHGVWQLP